MALAVLTRDVAATEPYARALRPLGLEVVAMPVTRIAPTEPAAQARLAAALAELDERDAIVVASAHGAAALLAALGLPDRLRRPGAPALWAVGSATAAALAGHGLAARTPPDADARGLAAAVVAGGAPRRAVVPRARGGRDEGVAALAAAGVDVVAVDVYQSLAAEPDEPALAAGWSALADDALVVVALFAPSQVAALDRLLAARGGLAALAAHRVAIGATTAAAITAVGAAVAAIAPAPTPDGLARAIAALPAPRRA